MDKENKEKEVGTTFVVHPKAFRSGELVDVEKLSKLDLRPLPLKARGFD